MRKDTLYGASHFNFHPRGAKNRPAVDAVAETLGNRKIPHWK